MKPWIQEEPEGWAMAVADFGQRREDRGATVTLHGKCPRCKHEMSVDLPDRAASCEEGKP